MLEMVVLFIKVAHRIIVWVDEQSRGCGLTIVCARCKYCGKCGRNRRLKINPDSSGFFVACCQRLCYPVENPNFPGDIDVCRSQ